MHPPDPRPPPLPLTGLTSRRRAVGVAFCLLALLLAVGGIGQWVFTLTAPARRAAQIDRYKRQLYQAEEKALAGRGKPGTDEGLPYRPAALMQGGVDLIRRTTGDLTGDDRKTMEAMARIGEGFRDRAQTYELATANLRAAGWASGAGLDGREAIALRRTLVKNYADANRAMGDYGRNIESITRAEMRRELPEAAAERGVRLVLSAMHLGPATRLRDLEQRRAEAFDGLLALYNEQFPRWHLDANQDVVLDDVSARSCQQRWNWQLTDAAEAQTRLLQEVVASHQTTPSPR